MQRSTYVSRFACVGLVAISLLMLPGCAPLDWLKKNFGGGVSPQGSSAVLQAKSGTPLLTIDGVAVITDSSLEEEFNQVIAAQPLYQQIAEQSPAMKLKLMRDYYDGAKKKAIITKYVRDNRLDQQAAYQNELQQGMAQLKVALDIKAFVEQHPVSISEVDIRAYYEENKDKPNGGILLSQGGVKAAGVYFEKETDAQAFLVKIKMPGADFENVAQKENIVVKPFDVVHERTPGMSDVLKQKILAAHKFPSTDCVKVGDKSFCVVQYMSKEETKYRPYEQVRDLIEQQLKQERLGEKIEMATAKLMIQYEAQEHMDYWNELQQKAMPDMQVMASAAPDTPAAPETPQVG